MGSKFRSCFHKTKKPKKTKVHVDGPWLRVKCWICNAKGYCIQGKKSSMFQECASCWKLCVVSVYVECFFHGK